MFNQLNDDQSENWKKQAASEIELEKSKFQTN